MESKSIVYERAYKFAIEIVKISNNLVRERKDYTLSKQLLRCGTSVAANIKEATNGQSKKDFLSKISIALKEAGETEYWLSLLIDTGYISKDLGDPLLTECNELCKILGKIVHSTKNNLENKFEL